MPIKQLLKRTLENALSIRIYSSHPHGRDDCHDIARAGLPVRMVFDVGANDGGSAVKFARAFPDAFIYSFEPVTSTFEILSHNVQELTKRRRVMAVPLGLGATQATFDIHLHPHSTMSSIVADETDSGATEAIQVTTVDAFAEANQVGRIDLLKIDTEGYDLEVLKGSEHMLRRQSIQFVLAEVSLDRPSPRHVPFEAIRDFLRPHGFAVYGIYDQQLEWSGRKRLQYANACFILAPD